MAESGSGAGRIRVCIRCRPPNKVEKERKEAIIIKSTNNAVLITNPDPREGEPPNYIYAYDFLYGPASNSSMMYEDMAKPMMEGLFEGFNGTIFAYGQSGSGKTWSMMGGKADLGIIPRTVTGVFKVIRSMNDNATTTVFMSYMQLHLESLQDLLAGGQTGHGRAVKMRATPAGVMQFEGLTEHAISMDDDEQIEARIMRGEEKVELAKRLLKKQRDIGGRPQSELQELEQAVKDALEKVVQAREARIGVVERKMNKLIEDGNSRRAVSATSLNAESSRSHAIVVMRVEHKANTGKFVKTKMNMVDLAGSERIGKSQVTGDALKESIAINASLSALGNVINALSSGKGGGEHIPYRSSKLTYLLQEALGKNSNTIMIGAIGPAAWHFHETLNTLQFAARAKAVKTNASATVFELFPEPVKVQAEVAKTGSSPRTIWLNGLKPSGVDYIPTRADRRDRRLQKALNANVPPDQIYALLASSRDGVERPAARPSSPARGAAAKPQDAQQQAGAERERMLGISWGGSAARSPRKQLLALQMHPNAGAQSGQGTAQTRQGELGTNATAQEVADAAAAAAARARAQELTETATQASIEAEEKLRACEARCVRCEETLARQHDEAESLTKRDAAEAAAVEVAVELDLARARCEDARAALAAAVEKQSKWQEADAEADELRLTKKRAKQKVKKRIKNKKTSDVESGTTVTGATCE